MLGRRGLENEPVGPVRELDAPIRLMATSLLIHFRPAALFKLLATC
jgi:hypothetical protein